MKYAVSRQPGETDPELAERREYQKMEIERSDGPYMWKCRCHEESTTDEESKREDDEEKQGTAQAHSSVLPESGQEVKDH